VKILALDTTGDPGSIALLEDDRVLEEAILTSPDGLSHILFGEIEALLARHHISIDQIELFASASGPGSFTGVRIGLTAVKGLAEATGRKVFAISNLQTMAWYGSKPLRAIVLDARRGDIFGAVYDSNLELVSDEVVIKLDAWLASVPPEVEFITSGFPLDVAEKTIVPPTFAAAVGRIAAGRSQLAKDPAAIDANYVRRADAELMWKE
jgi:tRNA threonylcarbamoyladenosine biosynthesis protein TsaB